MLCYFSYKRRRREGLRPPALQRQEVPDGPQPPAAQPPEHPGPGNVQGGNEGQPLIERRDNMQQHGCIVM